MQKKSLHLKNFLLILSFSLFSMISYSQTVNSVTISANPTDCAPVNFTIDGTLGSITYQVVSTSHSISNGILTIDVHFNNPAIVVPALGSFSHPYTIGNIPAGSYSVVVNTILGPPGNPIFSTAPVIGTTVTSCCPLNPTIVPSGNISNSRVCLGDTILLSGSAPGATTFSWINSNGNPVSSDTTLSVAFFVQGMDSYTLEVGDGNCTVQTTFNVNVDTIPTTDLGVDTTICDNSSLILNAGGQAPNVIYNWFNSNNSSSILQIDTAGTYGVTLVSGTCVFTDSINLGVNPSPVFDLGNDTLVCFGETVQLDATVSGNVIYQWSDNSTNPTVLVDDNSTYTVTITNTNGCSSSDMIDITVNPEIIVGLNDTAIINIVGDSMTINAGTWSSYLWSTGETTPEITVNTAGMYIVTVTDANNCSASDTISVTVTNTENIAIRNVRIYPNPASDIITIDGTDWIHEVHSIEIYNQLGQLVQVKHEQSNNQINVQDLTTGLYIIRWKNDNNETLGIARLIKQ